jgi:hypothetical protein
MRLLELRGNEDDVDPRRAVPPPEASRKTSAREARPVKRPPAGRVAPADARVFPINARPAEKPRRRPIDLELLQQRIELLERRIQERARAQAEQAGTPPNRELEQLRQRMKLLERRIEGELWSARQREYTMLEMLARPTLKNRVKQHASHLLATVPDKVTGWLRSGGRAWWRDAQPLWWPRFAAAWHEALQRARR